MLGGSNKQQGTVFVQGYSVNNGITPKDFTKIIA